MEPPNERPALERLEVPAGDWTMEGAAPGVRPWPGTGRVSFEWLAGQSFLVQRWTVDLPEAPDGIAIIGAGDNPLLRCLRRGRDDHRRPLGEGG